MSVTVTSAPSVDTVATLRELALVDAKRFARHPLFIFGVVANFALIYAAARDRVPSPVSIGISPAFFLGILGLVVAHRLTTSLRRTHELVDSMPSSQRRRTAALCLACIVPFLAGIASAILIIVLVEAYPPERQPDAVMTWFGDYPAADVIASVLTVGAVAALGGPLLGVLIAMWVPFRGSALLAVVGLFFLCEAATHWAAPWNVLFPWSALANEHVTDGVVRSSTFYPGVSEVWYLVYTLLMCGLAAVGAMLRDPVDRRPLLWTAAALAVAAAGALTLTVT